jgi:putative membrane protein
MMYAKGAGFLAGCSGVGANALGCGRFGMPMMGFGLVLLILGVAAVIYFVRKSKSNDSAGIEMELLNARFIKGELTEEEYIKMKRVLKSK